MEHYVIEVLVSFPEDLPTMDTLEVIARYLNDTLKRVAEVNPSITGRTYALKKVL